ncbi:MAG: hypothetical protein IPM36_02835 [Lewinellaceae bacterium]|nr:hypothetical protein [Lewinellaceae bacterium]
MHTAISAFSSLSIRLLLTGAFIALTIYLGYFVERSNFPAFISAYGLFFALYAWLITRPDWSLHDRRWWLGVGIALRIVLLFSIPNLSDDFYRFLWDGRLAAQGIHPFAHPPVYFIENQIELRGITPALFSKLNSPEYYTVYPPVCQAVFWVAAKLFPESLAGGVFVLKLFLFFCELGVLWVLTPPPSPPPGGRGARPQDDINTEHGQGFHSLKSGKISTLPANFNSACRQAPLPLGGGVGGVVLYALNPLILLEITGNAHFEGAMLCFLLAGTLFLQKRQLAPPAAFWALAVASKLVPLLFLPIVWVQLGFRKGLRFLLFFSVFSALLFVPLLNLEILENMAGSLNLYFRQFAFNASGYYLLKAIGKMFADPSVDVGRMLGPVLGIVVFVGVWVLAFFTRPTTSSHRTSTALLLAATLYLALATTVHPWYIALPFGLSLLTKWRYPVVWTGVAMLSYSHYAGGGFQENYGLIALEYLILLTFAAGEYFLVPKRPSVVIPKKHRKS